MTGYSESTYDLTQLGENNGFIQKPFRPIDLANKVREVLEQDTQSFQKKAG
jgi:hypothetical protein